MLQAKQGKARRLEKVKVAQPSGPSTEMVETLHRSLQKEDSGPDGIPGSP